VSEGQEGAHARRDHFRVGLDRAIPMVRGTMKNDDHETAVIVTKRPSQRRFQASLHEEHHTGQVAPRSWWPTAGRRVRALMIHMENAIMPAGLTGPRKTHSRDVGAAGAGPVRAGGPLQLTSADSAIMDRLLAVTAGRVRPPPAMPPPRALVEAGRSEDEFVRDRPSSSSNLGSEQRSVRVEHSM